MKLSVVALMMFLGQWFCAWQVVAQENPSALSNVPYSAITSLAYLPPDDVVSYGDDPLQTASIWRANGASTSHAKLVVLVHGGCWLNAYDIKHTYALSTALAKAGYSVWSLEYRRTGDQGGGWPGTLHDIEAGIKRIDSYAKQSFKLADTVLMGHSAGGHLALLSSTKITGLRGVIGLAAISDIAAYSEGSNSCQQAGAQFMGGRVSEIPEQYALANPAFMPVTTPTVLLHGDADTIVPLDQAMALNTDRVIVKGAGHFDWLHPSTPAFQTLLGQLEHFFK